MDKIEGTNQRNVKFNRKQDETRAQFYARGQQWVGDVQRRQKRYIALAEIEKMLLDCRHVQNRTLQTHLTPDQYAAMEAAWAQQKLMRSGSKHKPQVIRHYEAELNRLQLQDVKAKDLHKRGHAAGAIAIEELCSAQMQALLAVLDTAVADDAALAKWLDRPIPISASSITVDDLPRCITSNSKSSKAVRKSRAQIKLDAVQAAIRALEKVLTT